MSSGYCCKWCDEVAGTYEYPDVPKDVYRRHTRCTCSVEYDPGDGKRQNVHNKNWTDQENNDKIENRKNIRGISLYHPELKKSLDLDDFEEATIHECGHAKLIYGMHNRDVEKLYRELEKDKKSGKGLSRIAENDGVECIAEAEVLLSRGRKCRKSRWSYTRNIWETSHEYYYNKLCSL